ncbi:hypothetical protein H5U35_05285 [Candidatus Aerophobetes bacterium]|nr:hypothetical protein [Candidatus Aerophobetes bacterium]
MKKKMLARSKAQVRGRSIFGINSLLKEMYRLDASDLHLVAGSSPRLRISGVLSILGDEKLSAEDVRQLVWGAMTPEQIKEFEKNTSLDFTYAVSGIGRFRFNVHFQRGTVAASIRRIPLLIRSLEELNLPSLIKDIALQKRVLCLSQDQAGAGSQLHLQP